MSAYTASIGKTRLRYELNGGELICTEATHPPGLVLTMDLSHPALTIASKNVFSRRFWMGLVAVGIPTWTFGAIFAFEGGVGLMEAGSYGFVHLAFFVVGVILLVANRRRLKFTDVIAGDDGIAIWSDRDRRAEYDQFVAGLKEEVARLNSPLDASKAS